MDSTAGDLNHATRDLNDKMGEKSSDDALREKRRQDDTREKQEYAAQSPSSSSSSSQDVTALEKLDSKVVKIGEVKEGDEAYAHLPPHEREIVKRQLEIPPVTVNFRTLYRYATRNDLIIVCVSAIAAIGGGAVMPLMTV